MISVTVALPTGGRPILTSVGRRLDWCHTAVQDVALQGDL